RDASGQDEQRRDEITREVEPALGRSHENGDPALLHERVQDLLRALALLGERHHAPVHRRTRAASEVRRATGVDVEIAAAGAMDLLLDRLDGNVVVCRAYRLEG